MTREPEGRRPGGVKNDVKPRPPERRRPQPSRSCEIGAEGFGYSVEYSSIISTRRPLSFTAEGALPLRDARWRAGPIRDEDPGPELSVESTRAFPRSLFREFGLQNGSFSLIFKGEITAIFLQIPFGRFSWKMLFFKSLLFPRSLTREFGLQNGSFSLTFKGETKPTFLQIPFGRF